MAGLELPNDLPNHHRSRKMKRPQIVLHWAAALIERFVCPLNLSRHHLVLPLPRLFGDVQLLPLQLLRPL